MTCNMCGQELTETETFFCEDCLTEDPHTCAAMLTNGAAVPDTEVFENEKN